MQELNDMPRISRSDVAEDGSSSVREKTIVIPSGARVLLFARWAAG
jgi:hypothetical protein